MIVLLFSLFQWRISYFIPFNRSKLRSNPETIWFTLSVYLIHYKVLSIKFMIFSFTVSFDSVCSTSSPLTRPKSTLLTFLSYTVIITPQPMSLQPLCPFSSNHVLTLFNSKPFTDYPFSLRFKKKKKKSLSHAYMVPQGLVSAMVTSSSWGLLYLVQVRLHRAPPPPSPVSALSDLIRVSGTHSAATAPNCYLKCTSSVHPSGRCQLKHCFLGKRFSYLQDKARTLSYIVF